MNIKQIIAEIESDENKRRKAEHVKRHDVYNDHQRPHVLTALMNEFSPRTVSEMRTCTSINLSRRMVDEMASLYKRPPVRSVELDEQSGEETEQQKALKDGILDLYEDFGVNIALKRANQKFKLHDQCAIQVIPKDGKIVLRVLAPHQYDVIPDPDNPEKAIAYIISTYDRGQLDSQVQKAEDVQGSAIGSKNEQNAAAGNLEIGDQQDYLGPRKKYIIWTKDQVITSDAGGGVMDVQPNPIGALPFIDVAHWKDFEFWVRRGSGVVEFAIDFSVVLSDTVNTNRLQSYAQAVIIAEKAPEAMTVGPQHVLFLPLDPSRPEMKPSFGFENPSPDMKSSLELQDRLLNYFLTSRGIDPKSISGDGKAQTYSSGLERLLSMIDRFDASQDDLDIFKCVEYELAWLLQAWYQAIRGTAMLDAEYDFGEWPESAEICVNFAQPQMLKTDSEKEQSVVYRLDNGLMSRVEAMMELRGVSKEEAERLAQEIDTVTVPTVVNQNPNQQT